MELVLGEEEVEEERAQQEEFLVFVWSQKALIEAARLFTQLFPLKQHMSQGLVQDKQELRLQQSFQPQQELEYTQPHELLHLCLGL